MGVKHLWTILQGAGTSFDYESLQGQVISVDINIWLHQIQSHRGQNPHAYLIDLLKRICKLLNYGIKPIFVFDGAHPKLKRDTIISRDSRRKHAQKQHDEAKFRHILKTIHSQLLQGQIPCLTSSSSGPADMFELPSSSTVFETDHYDDEYDDLTSIQQIIQLNPKSEEFSNLPSDLKTGILALQSKISITSFPNDQSGNLDSMKPEDVSNEQIRKLKERRKVRQTIDNINREKKEQTNNSVIEFGSQSFKVQSSEKVISDDTKHVILVKKLVQNDSKFSNMAETGTMDQSSEPYTPVTHVDRYYEVTGISEPNGNLTNQIVPTEILNDTEQPKKLVKVSLTNGTQFFAEQEVNGKLTSITSYPHSQSSIQDINPACVRASVQVPHAMENLSPHMDCMHLSAAIQQQQGFKRSKSPKDKFKSHTAGLGLIIPLKSAVKCMDSHTSDEVFTTPSFTPHAKRVCVQDTPSLDIEPNLALYTETVRNSISTESIPPTPISPSYHTSEHPHPSSVPLPPTPYEESDLSNDTTHSSLHSLAVYQDMAPSSSLEEVRREMAELSREMTRNERMIHGVNREIQDAVMELLNVFGIPFIVAPFEAEAQCANLELNRVTTGTITDDSDIFLFGGDTVYRHFFSMKSRLGPQCYSMNNIRKMLDMERQDLVRLAFLLGCDYTEGVKGIGPKHAAVLLKSFKSEGLQPLTDILATADMARSGVKEKITGEDGLLGRVEFPKGFPDENVWVAFMTPLVDPVPLEEFKWGSIDVDKFVNFSKRYFNWKECQAREQITPVLRRQSIPKQSQLIPRCTPSAAPQNPIQADYKKSQLNSGSDSD